MRKNSEDTLRV